MSPEYPVPNNQIITNDVKKKELKIIQYEYMGVTLKFLVIAKITGKM